MPSRRLAAWTLVAFGALALLAAIRVRDWSYGADTGTFMQLILDTSGGMRNGVEHGTHYRFHWSPALAVLWPLLAATRSAWVLQAILAAATVACAPLAAAIARPRLGDALAERCGYATLLYPPLVGVGFGEFRDLGLLPVLALGWWLAVERRRWAWVAVTAAALAGLREDVCLEIAIVGAGVAVDALLRRDAVRAIAGAGSSALALASGAAYALVVLPRVGPWLPSHFYDYPFAHGPAALIAAPVLHPLAFAGAIATLGRLTYVLEAFAPLALLPLRSPLIALAIPGFAIVLFANSGLVWRMGMHYAALWIPWVLVAFIDAIARMRAQQSATTAALMLCAVVLVAFNPLHPAHYLRPSYHDLVDARAALAMVPRDATVATHDEWYTAVAGTHPGAMVFGDVPPPARYLVFAQDFPNATFQQMVRPRLRALVQNGRYRLVFQRGAVVAYER